MQETEMKENLRCTTGIEELDTMLGGGIPVGNTVLITGSSGSGKTTLCMQYLVNGAKKVKEAYFSQ
jgi:KaiC/GvpD/RAD55 family RecA-like ATPase